MSPTPTLSQLNRDWLDALGILGREIGRLDVLRLNERWHIDTSATRSHHLIEVGDDTAYVMREGFESLPRIERVEILLYTATALDFGDGQVGGCFAYPREAFVGRCRRVGCHFTNTPDIRERWRAIDWTTPAHLLPLARFETRPTCQMCASPVATGSEAIRPFGPVIHEECLRYAHRVLVPELRAAREAAKAAGEVGE